MSDQAGLIGAASMVLDGLLSANLLTKWVEHRSPAGRVAASDHERLG